MANGTTFFPLREKIPTTPQFSCTILASFFVSANIGKHCGVSMIVKYKSQNRVLTNCILDFTE
jgi:hypothetical protein